MANIEKITNGMSMADAAELLHKNDMQNATEITALSGRVDGIQTQIDQINQYQFTYGIEKNIASSATTWTRVGNMAMHRTLPIQSKMRRCLLKDDGSVNYWLHPNDSTLKEDGTPAILDGADGQVMVWIPPHYRSCGTKDGKYYCYMSEYPFPGSILFEGGYVSEYPAEIDRTDPVKPKLCSVVNRSDAFRGGNNTADWDGTHRDLRGMSSTAVSLTNFRTYARNRGIAGRGGVGWNAYAYDLTVVAFWLYTTEYSDSNVQATYNSASTSDGFKQGGLGLGVTALSAAVWSTYNGANPFIPCGYTNSLGNNTGVVSFSMPAEYGSVLTVSVPSYRGIENPFGHIHSLIDGCFVSVQSDEAGGESRLYVCSDLTKYGSSNYDDYENRGLVSRTGGYITKILMGAHGDNIASAVDGSSSTFFADYFAAGTPPTTGTERRAVLMGGSAGLGAQPGLSCSYTNNSIVITGNSMGTRLCFIPE